ncbi:unnamed protein product [Orchesella dallaii]|uniref:Reverse transcriptase domain-containing protein n=1 Tax=Orchesella dallaii TaxID=48710 RepID=A0ABP1QQY6_9HEXA
MIHINHRDVNILTKKWNAIFQTLTNKYPDLTTEMQENLHTLQSRLTLSLNYVHMKKLDDLILDDEVKDPQFKLNTIKNTITNLSKHQLTDNEEKLLSLGLNYCPPCQLTINGKIDLIQATEIAITKAELEETEANMFRSGAHNIIENYKPPTKQMNRMNWIKSTTRQLQSDKDIVILHADKGNSTVLLDKEVYEEKILSLLNTPDYTVVTHEPTLDIKKKLHGVLDNVVKRENMEPKDAKQFIKSFIPTHSFTPRLFGLPKTHKKDIPLRPVVDCQKSVTYGVASNLNYILKPITNVSERSVKNSYEFVEKIKKLRIPRNHKLVSFDVVSLFTKVPIAETIEFIRKRLHENDKWKTRTKLSLDEVMELVTICLNTTYFRFRDKTYKQLKGTPMGSPLSPVIADLCMEWVEENVVTGNPHIKFWIRYVDDIFAIVHERHIKSTCNSLNAFHPSIQFTLEQEPDTKPGIPFLDVFIYRKPDNSLGHKIYRKPTHTNRYLHFTSFHPKAHKISVVDSLVTRAIRISDSIHLQEELDFIVEKLQENGYPKDFIKKRIDHHLSMEFQKKDKSDEEVPRAIFPYYGNVTDQLSKYTRRHTTLEIGYSPVNRLSNALTKVKDPNHKEDVGIYKIPCDDCPAIYVGETFRDIKIRAEEHKRKLMTHNIIDSAVANHAVTQNHSIDFSKTELIEKETNYYRRKMKESLYIRKTPVKMNKDNGMNFNPIWLDLLLPLSKPP